MVSKNIEELVGRIYNWKYASASAVLKDLTPKEKQIVGRKDIKKILQLSKTLENIGRRAYPGYQKDAKWGTNFIKRMIKLKQVDESWLEEL